MVFSYRDRIYIGDIILDDVVIRYAGIHDAAFDVNCEERRSRFSFIPCAVLIAAKGRADIPRAVARHALLPPGMSVSSSKLSRPFSRNYSNVKQKISLKKNKGDDLSGVENRVVSNRPIPLPGSPLIGKEESEKDTN